MYKYVIKRLLMLIPVIICVSLLIYVIMELAPGNILAFVTPDDATPEQVAELERQYGYDKPVLYRYAKYMGGLLRGDMGVSFISKQDVFKTYMQKLPNTLLLALSSVFVAVCVSIPLGIYAAIHNGSIQDNASMVVALLGVSMPNFWLGLLLIIAFSLKLGWFPSGGFEGPRSIVLPAFTSGISLMAIITRTTRSSMLDVIRQDYLRTARAKGVSEKKVIRIHALKNALIPIITVIGTQLAAVLGGSILIETIFAWPGVGRLVIDSLNSRDVPMITGCIILKTVTISIILLIVDLLYALVDPKIKAQYTKGGKLS